MNQRPMREPPIAKKPPVKEPPKKDSTPIGDPPKKRRPHTDVRCSPIDKAQGREHAER